MAKKKRMVRKPVIKLHELDSSHGVHTNKEENDAIGTIFKLNKVANGDYIEELGQNTVRQSPSVPTFHTLLVIMSWAKDVELEQEVGKEQDPFQESAKSLWNTFAKEKVLNRDSKLSYTEPLIKNGLRIAQVDYEEVREQNDTWNSTVICMTLGVNPPTAVFEGFIKRIWEHLGIV
uniref:Uncharacterized protein n=1 Tax=Cannabis sativa TaxID=3483 RepID=A0A803PIX5_CANSA